MGVFGDAIYRDGSTTTHTAGGTAKVSPTVSTTYQLEHTLDEITVSGGNERVELWTVGEGIALDYTHVTPGVTFWCAYTTTESGGGSESAKTDVGSHSYAANASQCTSNTFNAKSLAGSPILYTAGWGKGLTVKTYEKHDTTSGVVTAMCSKDATAGYRKVKRVQHRPFKNPVRGCF